MTHTVDTLTEAALRARLGDPAETEPDGTDVWVFDAAGSDRAVFIQYNTAGVRLWQCGWPGVAVASLTQLNALLCGLRVLVGSEARDSSPAR